MTQQELAHAFQLHRAGRLEEAEASYAAYLARHPESKAALNNAGVLAMQSGHAELAVARFEALVRLVPEQASALSNLGYALTNAGRTSDALKHLERAVAIDPNDSVAYNNLGIAFERLERRADGIAAFEQALGINPRYADAATNLGAVLNRDDDTKRARAVLERALAAQPDHMGARATLAATDWLEGRLDIARAALEALAARASVSYAPVWQALGNLRFLSGDFVGAEAAYRRAVALEPGDPVARFGVADALLGRGAYAEGWRAFEERPGGCFGEPRRFAEYLQWRGEPLDGTLLLYCEQGLGDIVQFARFIPAARRRVRKLVMVAEGGRGALQPLLATLSGIDEFCVDEMAVDALSPRPSVRASILSLPFILGVDVAALPGEIPYLSALPNYVVRWEHRFAGLARPRVGLVWAAHVRRDLKYLTRMKSIPVCELAPLLSLPGLTFVSLQVGPAESLAALGALAQRVVDFTGDIRDFGDTAAIISQLDLVISSDTSVAHVAGAMGKPTWLVDRFNADWRWRLDKHRSPWYPTARIFRQDRFGEWAPPIARICTALRDVADSRNDARLSEADD
jgi:tetratricopeptide (TPR) repeat protein